MQHGVDAVPLLSREWKKMLLCVAGEWRTHWSSCLMITRCRLALRSAMNFQCLVRLRFPFVISFLWYLPLQSLEPLRLLVTFHGSRRWCKIYSGHARLHVSLSAATCPHYCTDPNVTWGNGKGCPLLVQHWADLQSVHGLCCYGSIVRMRNVSECLYSLYAWFSLSFYLSAVFLKNLFMDFHEILRRVYCWS